MQNSMAMKNRSFTRLAVEWAVFLLLAALLVETWMLRGLIAPCRVVGGSMAESVHGDHLTVVCDDCGYRFDCGLDRSPMPPRAVCPNCGYAENSLQKLADIGGDRVMIDRAAFILRPPRRWEVAALRQPNQADQIVLKRIVGLPGETIEIRRGDVYIDGQIARKTLEQQHALAVEVNDAAYRLKLQTAFLPQWQPENSRSRWICEEKNLVYRADDDTKEIDWLVYHHGRRGPNGFVASPVLDLYGYNQTRPRRDEDVHAVADLMLSFRLTCESEQGEFHLRATDGAEQYTATLRIEDEGLAYEVLNGGERIADAAGEIDGSKGPWHIEASLIDRCFLLAIDGRTVVRLPIEREEASPVAEPLAIGIRGMKASIDDLRVFRDVYYTHPIGLRPSGPVRLGPNEYFALGDNSPASEDSRHWPYGGAIEADLLVGRPIVVLPMTTFTLFSRWRFNVPNPLGIRYIQ